MVGLLPRNRETGRVIRLVNHARAKAAVAAAALLAASGLASASTASDLIPSNLPVTFAGSYLAGRSADLAEDMDAAVHYYGDALSTDPNNAALAERLLLLSLASGQSDRALALAERLTKLDGGDPIARITLASRLIAEGKYDQVADAFNQMAPAPLASLTTGLLTAWAQFGAGNADAALATIDKLSGPSWYGIFKDYHTALILDAIGRETDALAAIKKAYDTDDSALRIVDGYARISARAGKKDQAVKALVDFAGNSPLQPLVRDLLTTIKVGKKPPPLATTAATGAAEALYGLGSAIGTDQGPELPAAYLRLAIYLDPTSYLAAMAIGDVFQAAGRCDEAIPLYDSVPKGTSLRRNADLQIGHCLQTLDKPDEAAAAIERVLDADPKDIEAAIELGDVYRANDQFVEAAAAYTRGIDAITDRAHADWRIFYFRGVSYERSDNWPRAEADFKQALVIDPQQPQVLNYLGYSWVDKGMHLKEALKMIKTAVDLRPNDGYIVDSLGWAYFKLGRYDDAVKELETAVGLKPDDPTINEHLGDAYWKIGRKRDAVFQWTHARDLDPEKSELPVILAKLQHGLKDPPPTGADTATTVTAAAAQTTPTSVTVAPGDSLWTIANRVYGDSAMYLQIYQANRGLISNPDRIFPGMTLTIPAAATN